MPEEALDLVQKYPNVYQSFWSASDVIERSSDGFTVVSHVVVTPNQTQTTCPEVCCKCRSHSLKSKSLEVPLFMFV